MNFLHRWCCEYFSLFTWTIFWINAKQNNCFFISYYRIWVFSYFLFYFKRFPCLVFFLTFSVCFFLLLSLWIFFPFASVIAMIFSFFIFFENQHHIDEVEGFMLFSISNTLPVVYSLLSWILKILGICCSSSRPQKFDLTIVTVDKICKYDFK